MADNYYDWATKTIAAYKSYAPAICAERALDVHIKEACMEGDLEIQVWHLICSLAAYSDSQGYFRDQVFGPKQHGGPMIHKVASGLRDFCAAKSLNYEELYREVCEHLDAEPPANPSI